jgi:glutaminyl-peptide cyclotransferase
MSDLREISRAAHPLGSDRQKEVADFIADRARQIIGRVEFQEFDATVPRPRPLPMSRTETRKGRNIIALPPAPKSSCVVLWASHYDTKHIDGFDYLGANDSASSSAALLALLSALNTPLTRNAESCDLGVVWFDGEESVLPNWFDGERAHPAMITDHTYGSRFFVSRLTPCSSSRCLPASFGGQRLHAVILLDMIGSPDLRLTRESRSHPELLRLALEASRDLGSSNLFSDDVQPIEDDHIPFVEAGIPSINLIDFQHLDHWHRPTDTPENISVESLVISTKVALLLGLNAAERSLQ